MTALDPTAPGRDDPAASSRLTRRLLVTLVVLLAAQFMLAVDFSILNVALPAIGRGLRFGISSLQWISTLFALAAAGFTLLFGRLADIVGRRRQFMIGLGVLGAASLAGGLAADPSMLLIARVAQGLATAAVTPAGLSLLTSSFPEGPLRERALGLNGALMSAGFTTGAILGGVLTDLLSWRWAFFINVPVAAVILLAAPAVLTEHRPVHRPTLDVPGAVTVTGGLLVLVYGLTRAGSHSWSDPGALGAVAGGIVLLGAFSLVEGKVSAPLIPPRIMRRRTVALGNTVGVIAFATETSLVFLMTLYLQKVLGFSPLAAGLSFGVLGVGTVTGGLLAPRVITRVGLRSTLLAGGVTQATGTFALIGLGQQHSSMALLLIATFVGGVGNMLVIVGFMVTATSGLPDEQQGMATGLATMSQQIGITMGTPIMSAIATAGIAGNAGAGPGAVLGGITTAVTANALLVLAGVALSIKAA